MKMLLQPENVQRCPRLSWSRGARTIYGASSAGLALAATLVFSAGVATATEQIEPEPAAAGVQQPESGAGVSGSRQRGRTTTKGGDFSGKAGYYAKQLHGRPTASGQSYDHGKLTCAHKTLPFGTKLKVVSRKNKRAVVVVVTDRGPYTPGMVLDVSGEAACQLGMVGDGLHHVDCYVVKPELAEAASGDSDM